MPKFFSKDNLFSVRMIVFYFITIKLIISLFPYQYGVFRDELLYLSMTNHLGWAYLEVPALPAFVLAIVKFFLGTSYFALHIIPAVFGSLVILLTALMTRRLGGSKFALILALICVTFAPQYMGADSIYTYDTFDKLFWALAVYFILILIQTGNKKYWLFFGVAAAFGLLSKITMLYLGFGLLIGFLMTQNRKLLWDKRFIIGGLIAFAGFLPFIIWQSVNGFPIFEYLQNYAHKLNPAGPADFFLSQIAPMNPFAFFIWMAGLFYFFFNQDGKKYRVLSIAYTVILAVMMVQRMKYYLITPFYPVLFAGGSVFLGAFIEKHRAYWLKPIAAGLILALGIITIPLVRPVLTPEVYIRYAAALGGKPNKTEIYDSGVLPQFFADRFGWEEMTAKVSIAFHSLSAEDQKKACIIGQNYGDTGALNFYGKEYGLPEAVGTHNILYFWGPKDYTGELMIFVGYSDEAEKAMRENFESVEKAGVVYTKYAMPFENNTAIYICRKLKIPLKDAWKLMKNFG